MDKRKQIIKELCSSPFIDKWILELKDNDSLFSVDQNLKPCIKVDKNRIKSSFWDGLEVLECYARRDICNDDVDDFIVSIINSCIEKYVEDKEENPTLRLDSSYAILTQLLQILKSRPDYCAKIDFLKFVKIYLSSPYGFPFSLVSSLKEFKLSNFLNGEDVFNCYKTIIEKEKIGTACFKYLANMREIDKNNGFLFYEYSKSKITSFNDFDCCHMGAFSSYPDYTQYEFSDKDILIVWFKESSKFITFEQLKLDINSFTSSDKYFLKRAGLALININFRTCKNIFYENIDSFLNNREYFSDVKELINTNLQQLDIDFILPKLETATFGVKEPSILRNHIKGIFKKYIDSNQEATKQIINYKTETTKDLNSIKNFNRMIYFIEDSKFDDVDYLYNQIRGKDPIEALNIYKNSKDKSTYYLEVFCDAYFRLIGDDYQYFIDNLDNFDSRMINQILFKLENDYQNLIKLLNRFIRLLNSDSYFNNCISTVLYRMQKLCDNSNFQDIFSLLSKIDYKKMTINGDVRGDSYINDLINENMHTYLEMLAYCSECDKTSFSFLKTVIKYLLHAATNHKTKSLISFIMVRLFRIDVDYCKSILDVVFDNYYESFNPSYLMYSISNDTNCQLLSLIKEKDDFKEYISLDSENNDIKMSQNIIFSRLLFLAFKEKDFAFYDYYIKSNNLDCLSKGFDNIKYWITNKDSNIDIEDVLKFCKLVNQNLSKFKSIDKFQIDQLIRSISKLLLASKK